VLSAIGVVASLVVAGALVVLLRPLLGARLPWASLVASVAGGGILVGAGAGLGIVALPFALGLAALGLPVAIAVEAGAVVAGRSRLVVPLLWGIVALPVSALVPIALTAGCWTSACGFEDFGGALPLFTSSAALLLSAVLGAPAASLAAPSRARTLGTVAVMWAGYALWLAHLEAAIDPYVPRLLLSALVVPACAALAWLVVSVLGEHGTRVDLALAGGAVAGMIAAAPGAASVAFPWSALVGALAGAAAGAVHAAPPVRRAGPAVQWALSGWVAAAVGFLAPPFSADSVGILYSAQFGLLGVPALALVAVSAGSALVGLLLRRGGAAAQSPNG